MKDLSQLDMQLHDLKNVLSLLLGNLELFCHPNATSADREKTGKDLLILIPQICPMAELLFEATQKQKKRNVGMSKLLIKSLDLWKKLGQYKNLRWNVRIEKDLSVSSTPGTISILSNNIFGNAVRHAASGGAITVTVAKEKETIIWETHNDTDDTDEDSDISLYEQDVSLGLRIIRKLVREMHGSVKVTKANKQFRIAIRLKSLKKV